MRENFYCWALSLFETILGLFETILGLCKHLVSAFQEILQQKPLEIFEKSVLLSVIGDGDEKNWIHTGLDDCLLSWRYLGSCIIESTPTHLRSNHDHNWQTSGISNSLKMKSRKLGPFSDSSGSKCCLLIFRSSAFGAIISLQSIIYEHTKGDCMISEMSAKINNSLGKKGTVLNIR